MTAASPPRALRVLLLPDRLVLHDITFELRNRDPSDRNSLIDATNSVHSRAISASVASAAEAATPNLIDFDLPTPPSATSAASDPSGPRRDSSSSDNYLVIPFAKDHHGQSFPVPYEASSPEQAGLNLTDYSTVPVEAAAGFLGLIRLHSAVFAVLVSQVRRAGELPSGPIQAVSRVKLIKLHSTMQTKEDRDFSAGISKLLEGGTLYYSLDRDLTQSLEQCETRKPGPGNAFWWSWPMARPLSPSCRPWLLRTVYGFVGTQLMRFQSDAMPDGSGEFHLTLISRRSRRRAGTRYITRGVDALGNVANFVETEQVVWCKDRKHIYSSFLVIRGSVPVFWRQNNGIARPVPELDGTLTASRAAFSSHFRNILKSYNTVSAVSLVDKNGSEGVLADAFERHFELDLRDRSGPFAPKLVAFDFHKHCAGKEYERGLSLLLSRIRNDIKLYGIFACDTSSAAVDLMQKGVFRVNCVDCLDRTNVVQSIIARVALNMQLAAVFATELRGSESSVPRLYVESEDRFKHVWGDNADAVSKQYSGTGALKTDFTRTGKRSTTGVIGDGMKSVMRMYYKNFVDEGRQEVIDILCGNAIIRPPSSLDAIQGQGDNLSKLIEDETGDSTRQPKSPSSTALWYSFESLRINAGGDKQAVNIELRDDAMLVTTLEGVRLEYPRNCLASWGRHEDGKSSDRKTPARLRLIYFPTPSAPATTSPLDLLFKGGATARENFLRALISWAQLRDKSIMKKQEIRFRTLVALNAGEHRMIHWGLDKSQWHVENEVVALILPEGNAVTRSWGLAAVPIDVDDSNYELVSACAVSDRGPAIAVLASKELSPQIMNVTEASCGRTSFSGGGAVAVALEASGTSLCFVGTRLDGPAEVFRSLSALKPGRSTFDITTQFHHFTMAGLMGDMSWSSPASSSAGAASRQWTQLGDDSFCYSLANGLSVLRSSFPTLRYNDLLKADSLWRAEGPRSRNEESISSFALSDCLVDGRPAPRLPKSLSQCVVSISDLRGEGICSPPGVDRNAQLNSLIVLYCDYSSVDGVVSRQVPGSSEDIEWRDTLRLSMIPSDPQDIYAGFIVGQILVPTPLADPVAAGHFVIPIALGREGPTDFSVACRLAGMSTGRVFGRIEVTVDSVGTSQRQGVAPMKMEDRPGNISSLRIDELAAPPPRPRTPKELAGMNAVAGVARGANGVGGRSGNGKGFATSSFITAPSKDDVTKNLDAARRKGSKQIKSVVNRLSSLLNQPSSSGTSSHKPTAGSSGDFEAARVAQVSSLPGIGRRERLPSARSQLPVPNATPSHAIDHVGTHERNKPARKRDIDEAPSYVPDSSADDTSAFGSFQAAPSESSERRLDRRTGSGSYRHDPLLSGLRGEKMAMSSSSAGRQPIPLHAQQAKNDPLLAGLASQKDKFGKSGTMNEAVDDDGWGDFEAAGP